MGLRTIGALGLLSALLGIAPPAGAQETGEVHDEPAPTIISLKNLAIGMYMARCEIDIWSVDEWALKSSWTMLQQLGYEPERIVELAETLPNGCRYPSLDAAILAADEPSFGAQPVAAESEVAEPVAAEPEAAEPVVAQALLLEPVLLDPWADESLKNQALGRFFHRCEIDPDSANGRQAAVHWEVLLELGYTPERIDELSRLIDQDCSLVTFKGAILVARNLESGVIKDHLKPSPLRAREADTSQPDRVDLEPLSGWNSAIPGTILGGTMSLAGTGLLFAAQNGPAPVAVGMNLLVAGIPTFIVGTVQLGLGDSRVSARANLELWRMENAARILQMFFLIPGVAMNAIGLTMAISDGFWEASGTLLSIGTTLSVTGFVLSAVGDHTAGQLAGREMDVEYTPGRLLMAAGVVHLVTGVMLLGSGAAGAALSLALSGDGSFGAPYAIAGIPYLVGGITMMVVAKGRMNSPRTIVRSQLDPHRPVLVGITPMIDVQAGTRGLSLAWKF